MKHLALAVLFLLMTTIPASAVLLHRGTVVALDGSGNFLVIETSQSLSSSPPISRVSLTLGSPSRATTLEYDGKFELVGSGQQVIYGIVDASSATGSHRRLVAIRGNQPLPADVAQLPGIALAEGSSCQMGLSEYLAIVEHDVMPPLPGFPATFLPAPRAINIVHFNGTSFDKISSTPIK